jgi:hypothetical protein
MSALHAVTFSTLAGAVAFVLAAGVVGAAVAWLGFLGEFFDGIQGRK